MALSETEQEQVRELLRGSAREALDAGAAPLLLRALDRPVAHAIVAERAEAYITLLYALLSLRRGHELEPLHEDLERLVAPGSLSLDPSWNAASFGRDLVQLEAWGCIERRTEPLKIRGYKDVRRERYRYRLSEDAVALLEWLELRAQAQAEGRTRDSRDLLIDVLGAIKELSRVVRNWHGGDRSEEAPRRALYLLSALDDHVHTIGEELLGFRAAMVTFAARAYDLGALQHILDWLERYVGVYLTRIETLRGEILARLAELAAPRLRRAFSELHAALARELADTPGVFRSAGVLREPAQILSAQEEFFADAGQLVTLSARIDESARGVLRKMHRHLRDIERRSARVEDLKARIAELARLEPGSLEPRLADFANALLGSAHGRFATRAAAEGARLAPPLPRRQGPPSADRPLRPLAPKRLPPEAARELRARRLAELATWLRRDVLAGQASILLSQAHPTDPNAPRRWLDVARALHLDQRRDLRGLRVELRLVPGHALVMAGGASLLAPDCQVTDPTKS